MSTSAMLLLCASQLLLLLQLVGHHLVNYLVQPLSKTLELVIYIKNEGLTKSRGGGEEVEKKGRSSCLRIKREVCLLAAVAEGTKVIQASRGSMKQFVAAKP